VRICDTYGAGFFFIPGTDTCLRIGGFVRADYTVNSTPGNATAGNGALGTSYFDQAYSTSIRLTLFTDARSNTEYGLLRAFGQFSAYRGAFSGSTSSQGLINSGAGQSPRASAISVERAFIQFAGFTFGFSASFFNFYQGDVQLSGNLAATARVAECKDPRFATAGFREPSLVFLTRTDLRMISGGEVLAFLNGNEGDCRVAFVESRDEVEFLTQLPAVSTGMRLAGRVKGININGGRPLDIGVWIKR